MGCSSSRSSVVDIGGWPRKDAISLLVPEELRSLAGVYPNLNHLDLKHPLGTNPNILRYINAYTTSAAASFQFLTNLRRCLDTARKASSSLNDAVMCFVTVDYIQCLTKMKEFSAVGDPFASLLLNKQGLDMVQRRAEAETATARKKKLVRRLSSVKFSRKAWKLACNSALILALVSAVVLAALGIPPVATTSAFAASTGIKSAEAWLDTLLKGHEEELEGEKEVVQAFGWVVVHELDNIRALAERVEIELGSLSDDVEFVIREEEKEAVLVLINGIGDKLKILEEKMIGLEEKVEHCSAEIKSAVADFFKLILDGL